MTNGNITNLEYVYCKQKHEVSHHNLTHCLRNLELSVEEESVFVQYTTHIKRALCRSTCFNKTYCFSLFMMVAAIGHYW